jgi:hypothetical protein
VIVAVGARERGPKLLIGSRRLACVCLCLPEREVRFALGCGGFRAAQLGNTLVVLLGALLVPMCAGALAKRSGPFLGRLKLAPCRVCLGLNRLARCGTPRRDRVRAVC